MFIVFFSYAFMRIYDAIIIIIIVTIIIVVIIIIIIMKMRV